MQTLEEIDIGGLLQQHFGYDSFRPLQEEIIQTILGGNDCLAVMPTGSGKSLCFQLPALCLDGPTLVISPLIALMKDQVDALTANGIPAAFLNSSQTPQEQTAIVHELRSGAIKLLYIAPERLSSPAFRQLLPELHPSLIAIDEAHCISEWGHEFRPDYRNLRSLREAFPTLPCIALTATATPRVQADIREQLKLQECAFFLSSFNRPNLTYHVYPKRQAFERVLLALRQPQRLPAIIYCFSRKDTEALAQDLCAEGFTASPYHAGLDAAVRRRTQERFMRDDVSIVTATIAFGMGIDKPDVRTVIHMDLPKTMEGYYQETGRAGRDGLPSDCILFYSYGDKFKQKYFINQIEDTQQKKMAEEKLQTMIDYGEVQSCRRAFLLSYFGEKDTKPTCEGCDRCLRSDERIDATHIAQTILRTVLQTGERFGSAYICDLLRGKQSQRARETGHDQLAEFGSVTEFDDRQLREIINQLVGEKLLAKEDGQYPTLLVTEKGRLFLQNERPLHLRKPEQSPAIVKRTQEEADAIPYDVALFEELRTLRRTLADAQGCAAYIIFGDRSLREMAAYYPRTPETFLRIYGVSERKLEHYGEQFLHVIRTFGESHSITEREPPTRAPTTRPAPRSLQEKGSTFDETRMLLEQHLPLAEIAQRRNLKEGTIIQHIEQLLMAGVPLSIDSLRPDSTTYEEVSAAFHAHGTSALGPVFGSLKAKYSYETLRLVRIFMKRREE